MSDTNAEIPERFIDESDLDGDQLLAVVQARHRGEPEPRFERREYREFRNAALRQAGIDDEIEVADPINLESLSVGDHFARIQRGRR